MKQYKPNKEQIDSLSMLFDEPSQRIARARESRVAKLHPDFLRPAYQYTPSEVYDEQFMKRYGLIYTEIN